MTPGLRSPRMWVAFAMLPFVDALTAFITFPIVWSLGGHGRQPYDAVQAARAMAILNGVLGLVVTIAGGIPAVITFIQRGTLSLRRLLVAGLLFGNVPFAFYVLGLVVPATIVHLIEGTMGEHWLPVTSLIGGGLTALAIGSAMGAWSALVFWFLGIYGSAQENDRLTASLPPA